MPENEPITLKRDCEAILIPSGTPVSLKRESVVFITQALGGNFTVNINGNLAQIAAKDADALGYEADNSGMAGESGQAVDGSLLEELVWNELRTCYDPEIPYNIVDLGLVYDCTITPIKDGGNRVDIVMTLTAPGCGMGEFLAEDVRSKVAALANVSEVNVALSFDPPWNQEMMSESTRMELGLY
ncbi:MAG: putative Fe-S cluster assembly protein SufT [Gammaproteobacteria bacterium]